MPGFKVELRERVWVLGLKDVQGIVIARMESLDRESIYTVRWLTDDASLTEAHFSESEIAQARKDYITVAPETIAKIDAMVDANNREVAREDRNRKRREAYARKRSRKAKRSAKR